MNALHITNELRRSIDELADVARLLWERGWAESNAGNISIDVTGKLKSIDLHKKRHPQQRLPAPYPGIAKRQFLVTGAGTRMRDVAAKPATTITLIEMNDDGSGYSQMQNTDNLLPTSELPTHLAIFNDARDQNKEINAVVHTHPTELIALTHFLELLNEDAFNTTLWKIHPEAMIANPEGIGFVPYILTGTDALAQATCSALRHHSAAVWEKHGCIAAAETVSKAFDLIDVANKAATIYLLCRAAGVLPAGLTDQHIDELRQKLNSSY